MKRKTSAFWAFTCLLLIPGGIYWLIDLQGPYRAALRSLKAGSSENYFDIHGNGCDEIQLLMRGRFAATSRICNAIDDEPAGPSEFKVALFLVLGFVKDPSTIPWLEAQLAGPDASLISTNWLAHWTKVLGGNVSHDVQRWLAGRDAWAAFFRRWIARSDALALRPRLFRVMTDWFHDPATVAAVAEIESSLTEGEEILIAQIFLQRHGRTPDRARLEQAIARLGGTDDGDAVLCDLARDLKHEAFVPWLAAHADRKAAQDALQATTFELSIGGRENWEAWLKRHGGQSRLAWLAAAVETFEAELAQDEGAAASLLGKAVYSWNDILLLPHMDRWAARPALGDEILGWINLTYHPAYRERLRALVDKVLVPSSAEWARDLMKGLEYGPADPRDTWERHVEASNRRI